jgi:hypothetical protein
MHQFKTGYLHFKPLNRQKQADLPKNSYIIKEFNTDIPRGIFLCEKEGY